MDKNLSAIFPSLKQNQPSQYVVQNISRMQDYKISYFFLSYFYCLSGLLNFYFLPFSQNIQIHNLENISIWCCGNLYFCYYNIILSLLYYYLCYKLAVKYICKYGKDSIIYISKLTSLNL